MSYIAMLIEPAGPYSGPRIVDAVTVSSETEARQWADTKLSPMWAELVFVREAAPGLLSRVFMKTEHPHGWVAVPYEGNGNVRLKPRVAPRVNSAAPNSQGCWA